MKIRNVVAAIAAISVLALLGYQIILVAEKPWVIFDSLVRLAIGTGIGGVLFIRQSRVSEETNGKERSLVLVWAVIVMLIFGVINKNSFLILLSIGIPIGYFICPFLVIYIAHKHLKNTYNFWVELPKEEQECVLMHSDVFWEKRWGNIIIFIQENDGPQKLELRTVKNTLQKKQSWDSFKRTTPSALIGVVCDFIDFISSFVDQKQMIKNWDRQIYGDHITEVPYELMVQRRSLEETKDDFLRKWGIRPDD